MIINALLAPSSMASVSLLKDTVLSNLQLCTRQETSHRTLTRPSLRCGSPWQTHSQKPSRISCRDSDVDAALAGLKSCLWGACLNYHARNPTTIVVISHACIARACFAEVLRTSKTQIFSTHWGDLHAYHDNCNQDSQNMPSALLRTDTAQKRWLKSSAWPYVMNQVGDH